MFESRYHPMVPIIPQEIRGANFYLNSGVDQLTMSEQFSSPPCAPLSSLSRPESLMGSMQVARMSFLDDEQMARLKQVQAIIYYDGMDEEHYVDVNMLDSAMQQQEDLYSTVLCGVPDVVQVQWHGAGCCCCIALACLAKQVNSPEGKQTATQGMPHVKWAVYVVLFHNVCQRRAVGHDVCETMYFSVTVYVLQTLSLESSNHLQ